MKLSVYLLIMTILPSIDVYGENALSQEQAKIIELFSGSRTVEDVYKYFGLHNEYEISFELNACSLLSIKTDKCLEIHHSQFDNKKTEESMFLNYLIESIGLTDKLEVKCTYSSGGLTNCNVRGSNSNMTLKRSSISNDFYLYNIHNLKERVFMESINEDMISQYNLLQYFSHSGLKRVEILEK